MGTKIRRYFVVLLLLFAIAGLSHGQEDGEDIPEDVEVKKDTEDKEKEAAAEDVAEDDGKEKEPADKDGEKLSYRSDSTWLDLTFGVPMNITFYEVLSGDEKGEKVESGDAESGPEERGEKDGNKSLGVYPQPNSVRLQSLKIP